MTDPAARTEPPRCPICGNPARAEKHKTIIFHVAKWVRDEPHVADQYLCTSEPAHTWEVFTS